MERPRVVDLCKEQPQNPEAKWNGGHGEMGWIGGRVKQKVVGVGIGEYAWNCLKAMRVAPCI